MSTHKKKEIEIKRKKKKKLTTVTIATTAFILSPFLLPHKSLHQTNINK
jgi:hypothetical protein